MPTVTTQPMDGCRALLMKWERQPNKDDVRAAFVDMTALLNARQHPHWVIVDIMADPVFPLTETIAGAFWGPSRSPALAEWLVVGSSPTAQLIGSTLTRIARRDNIRWFATHDEALDYLRRAETNAVAAETPL
jgi:hypothetical protein